MTSADLAQEVGGWSEFALALVGLLALVGTVFTLVQSRRHARRARTLDYMRRLFGLEFAPVNARVLTFLRTGKENVFLPRVRAIPRPSGQPPSIPNAEATYKGLEFEWQARIFLVLNFYEEVSTSFRARLLDKRIARNMLAPAIEDAWDAAKWFVEGARDRVVRKLIGEGTGEEAAKKAAMELLGEWGRLVEELNRASGASRPVWRRLRDRV